MACKYIYAKDGFKFVLTELGMEINKARSKYEDGFRNKPQYEKMVPVGWVKSGWVKQVRR